MKLGEAMYKQQRKRKAQPALRAATGAAAGEKKEDVVDAEFTEVDDKNDKKSA